MTPRKPAEPPNGGPYDGSLIAVGTRHGKEHQLAPAFREVLGSRLVTPPDLDTDQFGTFSGETTRPGTAGDAARAKARLAMRVSGLPYGLASEASYGPLPGSGWYGHEEILVFVDDTRGIEVLQGHRTTAVPGTSHRVANATQLPPVVTAGLPAQALIVRPATGWRPGDIVKGITVPGLLTAAVATAAASPMTASPSSNRICGPTTTRPAESSSLGWPQRWRFAWRPCARPAACPACGTPGFGRVGTEPGLPCRACATPTALIRNEIHACPWCSHRISHAAPVVAADPSRCPDCNP